MSAKVRSGSRWKGLNTLRDRSRASRWLKLGDVRKNSKSREKKVENLALFSRRKNVVLNHHIHHAFHHDLTIKKPRFARAFSQKTPAKTPFSHNKKNPL